MSFKMTTIVAAPKQVLTPYDIQVEISACIFKVRSLLQVDSSYSLTLLLKFKWDIDALKESFHASQDLSDFLVSNNVTLKILSVAPILPECQLCLDVGDVKGLACRHMACSFCWKMYLKSKIERGIPSIECFACSLLICNDKLGTLLGTTELLTSYQKLVVNSYVENTSNLTWCRKKCGNALKRKGSNTVTCTCGSRFCFQCKQDPHAPASCEQMQRWERACKEHHALGKVADMQTWEYIQQYTEDCPSCLAFIVKNGGCSHMTCSKCRHEFCWDCREPWRYGGHHGNGCRHIKNPSNRANLENIAPYIISFNHHKQRIRNNRNSLELKKCHRTLMHSYVYGYYQEPGSDKEVFEKLQKDLEMEIAKSAQFWRSRQRMERCELLRKLLLDYCSSNRMNKKDFMLVKSNAKKGYMNYISSVLLALLLILVLLIMIIIVFFVQTC
ncbi:unnamed protein product [Caenorhabditis brenneri]